MAGTEDIKMTVEHPRIAIGLTITPPTLVLGENKPTLRITATLLGATRPITIFAYSSIFNIRRAMQRTSFTCEDLTAGVSVSLEQDVKIQRPGFQHYRGSYDDKHHFTLKPDVPRTFRTPTQNPGVKTASRTSLCFRDGRRTGYRMVVLGNEG